MRFELINLSCHVSKKTKKNIERFNFTFNYLFFIWLTRIDILLFFLLKFEKLI